MMMRGEFEEAIKKVGVSKSAEIYYSNKEALLAHDDEQRAVIEQLQEQLRLANIDQLNTESEVNAFHEERVQYNAKIEQQAKEIARLQAVNNDWQREFRGAVDSYNSLERENTTLREALQLLYDCQNGCPLPKYEADWNRAMRLSERALKEVS